jgi:hypothetical protein
MGTTIEGQYSVSSDLTSISNATEDLKTTLLKSIAPIELNEAHRQAYEDVFFTIKGAKDSKFSQDNLRSAVIEALNVGSNLNTFFAFIRRVFDYAHLFDDLPRQELEMKIQSLANEMKTNNLGVTEAEGNLFLHAFRLLDSVDSDEIRNNPFKGKPVDQRPSVIPLIKKSTRYKGGYDIIYAGKSNRGGMKISMSPYPHIDQDPVGLGYERKKQTNYNTEIALKAVKAAKRIMEMITLRSDQGAFSVESSNKRRFCQFPLDYSFESWNDEISKIMGMRLEFFKNLDPVVRPYRNFFSAVVIIEPPESVVFALNSFNTSSRMVARGYSSRPVVRPVLTDIINEESAYTRQVGSSVAINLDLPFVKYICQDESTDKVYYCLSTWTKQWTSAFLRPKNTRGGVNLDPKKVARYIVPCSRLGSMEEARKKLGLHVSDTKTNEDGLVVMPKGLISYMPRPEDASNKNAVEFERSYEDYLQTIYELNLTPGQSVDEYTTTMFPDDPRLTDGSNLGSFLQDKKKNVDLYGGSLLAFNWDYGTALYAQTSSDGIAQIPLNGCSQMDPLMIADFLGYDFKQSGQVAQHKTFLAALNEFKFSFDSKDRLTSEATLSTLSKMATSLRLPEKFTDLESVPIYQRVFLTQRMLHLFEAYSFFAARNKVKNIEELFEETKKQMGVDLFTTEGTPLDFNLYNDLIGDNISASSLSVRHKEGQGAIVLCLLLLALKDAQGRPGSNLFNFVSREVGYQNAPTEVKSHEAYFDCTSPSIRMADFGNVYNYFGGRLFKNMCKAITQIPKKDLLYSDRVKDESFKNNQPTSFNYIANDVLPMAVIFSKYVPNYLDYFEKAEDIFDQYNPDETIDINDIIAPGIEANKNSTKPALFPHQVKANQFLRKAPKFAILDISPGGGKTTIGIIDILCLAEKHKTEKFVPIVLAPDRLCANWCEDTAKFTKGNWNTIPITRAVVNVWGYDLLYKIIKEAPRNTILIVGLNFLSRQNRFNVSYGAKDIDISGSVEFIKQFNPSYVLLDESHKAKRFDRAGGTSALHSAVKEVTTMTGVKYIRLATGTLVHGLLEDVVGQAALLSSYALKTPDNMDVTLATMEREKLAGAIRNKLGKYCSLITLKRKEWAFMLPNPIDAFYTVRLFDSSIGADKLGNRLHQEAYEHVMSEAKEIMLKGSVRDLEKDVDISDEDEPQFGDDDDDSDGDREGKSDSILGENGEVDTHIMAMLDKKYFQRAEQMIVNPWGDDYFKQIADQAGLKETDFTPAPIIKTTQSIINHFVTIDFDGNPDNEGRVYNWKPEVQFKEFDVVEYKGKSYMRRALPAVEGKEVSITRRLTPASNVSPDKDPENWKSESRGKVLVLCRYIGNTKAIYEALPIKYRSKARVFHGKLKKSVGEDNIEQFKYNDDVQILIANEQAIAEGLNLQMASRIIRVDTPWSPGEYEQSTARIFRPDPAAAKRDENGKVGDISREVIYIDWIMCEGTLQVGKIARLMWKTVENVRFNEEGNEHYDPMKPFVLDKITMGMDLLFNRCQMEDYMGDDPMNPEINNYFGAKATLATLERQEFMQMRNTTQAEMIDMVIPPMPKDFKKLQLLPTLPNQVIPDPDDFGLIKLPDFIKQNLDEIIEDPEEVLIGLPVKTGFGTGTIIGIQRGNRIKDLTTGEQVLNPEKPITSVRIKYHASNEALKDIPSVNMPIEMVYVATKVDGKRADKFFKPTEANAADRARLERAAQEAAKQAEEKNRKDQRRAEEQARKDREAADRKKRTDARVKIRDQNKIDNKPINDGIEVVPKIPRVIRGEVEIIKPDQRIPVRNQPEIKPKGIPLKLIPTFYNGFLCLHVTNNNPAAPKLKKLGFENFDDFIYMDFEDFYRFEGLIHWLYKQEKLQNLIIEEESLKRLEIISDAFEHEHINPELMFNYKQAKRANNKIEDFFRTLKRVNRNKKLVRMYTIVMHDRLRVVVDVKTNPVASLMKGKLISAVGEKWKLHPGMHIYFGGGKREVVNKIKELQAKGYDIENLQSVIEAIDELRLR